MAKSFETLIMGAAGSGGGSYWISVIGETQALPSPGDNDATELVAIDVDSDGNAYSVGFSQAAVTPASMGLAAYIIKHDTDGNVVWDKDLYASASGTDRGQFNGLGLYSSGEPYVFGAGFYPNNNLSVVVKYNTSGVVQFMKGLSSVFGEFKGGGVSPSGNPYGGGYMSPPFGQQADLTYHRFNSSGAIQQGVQLNVDSGVAYDVEFDSSNNAYINGFAKIGTTYNTFGAFKVNTSDVIQWGSFWGDPSDSQSVGNGDHTIAVDDNGSVFCSGHHNSPTQTFQLVKMNQSNGNKVWNKAVTISSGDPELHRALAVDPSGNIYAFGDTTNSSDSVRAATIAKFNTSGVLQWATRLTVSGSEATRAEDIKVDSNGDIRIVLRSKITNSANWSSIVAKLPSDGSKTGTYGDWTYTDVTSTLTVGTGNLTNRTTTTRNLDTPSYGNVGHVAGEITLSTELVEL